MTKALVSGKTLVQVWVDEDLVDRCVCGRWITDGPFRFCDECRQVDLTTIRAGGGH